MDAFLCTSTFRYFLFIGTGRTMTLSRLLEQTRIDIDVTIPLCRSISKKVFSHILFVFTCVFTCLTANAFAQTELDWVDCAGEGQTCIFDGTKNVRYGNPEAYFYGIFDGQVLCSNRIFGDPARKKVKRCSYSNSTNLPPVIEAIDTQFTVLGDLASLLIAASDPEDGDLTYTVLGLPSGLDVDALGVVTGSPDFTGEYAISVEVTDTEGAQAFWDFTWVVSEPSEWTLCAAENEWCDFLGDADVRYGAGPDAYYYGRFVDGVNCSNSVFGDPARRTVKTCAYQRDTMTFELAPIADQQHFIGQQISLQVQVSGASSTLTFDASGLPDGLSINRNTGLISGVFSSEGISTTQITVSDGIETVIERSFEWLVSSLTMSTQAMNSSGLVYSQRESGDQIWVVNPDNNSVSIFNVDTDIKVAEVVVDRKPQSVALVDNEAWVVNRDSSTITIIDTQNYDIVSTIELPISSQPYGIVTDKLNAKAYVALAGTGVILKIDLTTRNIVDSLYVGQDVRGLSIDASANFLYASRFITPAVQGENTAQPDTDASGGELHVVSIANFIVTDVILLAHNETQDTLISARGIPNYLQALVISPDGREGWVASKQDNIKRGSARDGFNLNHENTVRAISSKIDLQSHSEVLSGRFDYDNASVASAAAYHPSGDYLLVSLETSREVALVELATNMEYARIPVGRAPKSLVLSPSGDWLFVHNFMDRTVTRHDLGSLLANIQTSAPAIATYDTVANEQLSPDVLMGKQHFYDAADSRLALEGYLSCASCHEDAGHDGRVWDLTGFGEGMRNTISLFGRSGLGHGRLHWTGNFDEVQDFEEQIRDLSGGTGLMEDIHFFEGSRRTPLGDTKAGLSSDLDAIDAYLSSLDEFPNSPWREPDGSLRDSAARGKALFSQSGCLGCHSGTAFSDSNAGVLHDIGTVKALSGARLGDALTGFDTPTLRGLWQSGPYLHDGSATSLQEAIGAHQNISLAPDALNDMADYLLSVDSREVSAPIADVWQLCAAENEICTFTGTRQVRYGSGESFNYGTFDESVACRNSVFGDPARRTEKFCYYRNTDDPIPQMITPEAQVSMINDIGQLQIEVINRGEIALTYSATGLPNGVTISAETGLISGTLSDAGNYSVNVIATYANVVQDSITFIWVVQGTNEPVTGWTYCGDEGTFCAFSGEAQVRYGGNGVYFLGTFINGVNCTNNVFGDPTPKVAKTCEYKPSIVPVLTMSNPGDQSSIISQAVTLALNTSYSGTSELTYTAENLPSGLSIDSVSGLISGIPDSEGSYTDIVISVSDTQLNTHTQRFNWEITSLTNPNVDGWVFCANENETCTFEGVKEVRYGSEINYFYGIFDSTLTCGNGTFGDPTPKIVKTCSYNSNGDLPPVITNPGSRSSAVGDVVVFTISAMDPENSELAFSATGLPDGITIDRLTGEISGAASTVDIYSVVVAVTDTSGRRSETTFLWTVQTEIIGEGNWVLCASDGDICNFNGEQKVRFGANGDYFTGFFTDSVLCSKSAFGDPLPGSQKACYYEIDPTAADWSFCADQDDICSFSGTKLVRYGAQRAYSYRVAHANVSCTDFEFGDPIKSAIKSCEVKDVGGDDTYSMYPINDDDEQWVYCSPNGFECHFSGTKQVRYILGDEYVEISATDSVFCSEASFPADPVVHAKKKEHCEVRLPRSEFGEWSEVQSWPVIPVSTTLLPDGRIMAHNATNDDLYTGYADVTLWDPVANTFSIINATQTTFAEDSSEMFCSGFDLMPDGNLLIAGSEPNVGSVDNLNAERFDYRSERFSRVNDNAYFRYYPSMTTMPSGDMVTFAGTPNAAPLEVFKFNGTWDTLSDTQDTYLNDYTYYAWGQTAPNGQLFYPGPDTHMKYFDLRGEGEEIDMGARDGIDRDYGSYALYDIGKLLITGGAKPATNTTTLIDINGPSPIVTPGEPMAVSRRHGNLTILADGSLLKTGGHTGTTHQGFEPDKAVYASEIWSPETQQWTTMASMRINRLYHSTAVLLPDGRVMSGGTGYPFYVKHNQSNGEIFSPAYLFDSDGNLAERPTITNAPDSVGYDHSFIVDIDTNRAITKVHLIKLGTVTHHQNFGQRLVPLEFSHNGNQMNVSSPEGANIAPPGYYMLIAVDDDGRPSVAKMIQVLPYSTVNLRSVSTNFMLDIAWGDTYENAFAEVKAQSRDLSQMWSMQPSDNGYFKFISRASGYALSNMDGVVSLGSDTGSFEEQWRFIATDNGGYALQSRVDGFYLAVDTTLTGSLFLSDTIDNGSSLQSSARQWSVLPVGDIHVVAQLSGQVLDAGVTPFNGDDVYIETNSGSLNQAWYFQAEDAGYVTLRSRAGSKALAIDGDLIVQQTYDGSEDQHWSLGINDNGSFKITSRVSALSVASNGAGYNLSQSSASDSANAWRIVPAVSGQPENISEGGGQILYRTLVEQTGLELWKTNGQTSGSENLDAPIEALEVSVNGVRDNLSIEYQVFDEVSGWSSWAADTESAGELGEAIYGLRVNLTGESDGCALNYRAYTDDNEWLSWVNADAISGSEGTGSVLNGIQITLVCHTSE